MFQRAQVLSLSIFVQLFAAGTALAQDSSTIVLKEVVVSAAPEAQAKTATKTDTPFKDVPASVAVVSKDVIQTQGAYNVDQVIRNVSGVTQSSSSNYGFFNNYLIRGLNVNFLRDGVPDASTVNGYARSLVDVEQVEVLKGPGSSLYGSGSPGGSVNLVSKAPQETPGRMFAQSFGSFDTHQSSFDATGPAWNDNVLYRFNVNYYDTEGFRDLARTSTEVLPTILWKVNEGHDVTFDFDYRHLDVVADTNGIPFVGNSLTQENYLLNVDRENKYYTPFGGTTQDIFRSSITDQMELTDMVTLRNNLVVLNRNLYLLRNAGGSIAAGSTAMTGRTLREQSDDVTNYIYQLEPVISLETGSVSHKILTGFEFQYHDISAIRSTANLPNITDIFNPVIPETSKSALSFTPNFDRDINAVYESLYLQDQVALTDQWKIRLGGRSDWFDTKDKNVVNGLDQHRRDHELSGQGGLVFEPVENVSFYGGYSNSKQAILSTESSVIGQPESGDQYELGAKTSLFDQKLDLNLALFEVTRKDFLVTIGTDTIPVGKQKTNGIEFDVSTQPIPGWTIASNYAYQDAELKSVPQAASNPSVEHNTPAGVPTHSASLWTTYELQNGPFKGFGFGGGATFKDSVFINLQNTSEIPSYVTGDLVFFYRKDWYEAQLNVTNVADVEYFRNGVNSGALPGDPLGVQGAVKVHF